MICEVINLLFEERASKITSFINRAGAATVAELARAAGTSESTVRRDIIELDRRGALRKVYGGAVKISGSVTTGEYDVQTKSSIMREEKLRIARYAAATIHSDDLVYIDAGTTTELMIPYIDAPGAVFVTNGIAHAKLLTQAGYTVYMTGGRLKLTTEAIVGHDAVMSLARYNFSKCFMGTNGIDTVRGYTTPDVDEALVKEAAVARSYVAYVLADSGKFGIVSSVTFSPIDKALIVTDSQPTGDFAERTVVKVVE